MTTHTPELSTTVAAYLDAAPGTDPASIAALFTPNAIVIDDGHTYRGRSEITSWRADVAESFTYTATRLSTERHGHVIVIVERIEGNFPGGRVDLANRFTLDTTDQISSLTIEPATAGTAV